MRLGETKFWHLGPSVEGARFSDRTTRSHSVQGVHGNRGPVGYGHYGVLDPSIESSVGPFRFGWRPFVRRGDSVPCFGRGCAVPSGRSE